MCGRFSLSVQTYSDFISELKISYDETQARSFRPRYNIAPGDAHWMINQGGSHQLTQGTWGFVPPWKEKGKSSLFSKRVNSIKNDDPSCLTPLRREVEPKEVEFEEIKKRGV